MLNSERRYHISYNISTTANLSYIADLFMHCNLLKINALLQRALSTLRRLDFYWNSGGKCILKSRADILLFYCPLKLWLHTKNGTNKIKNGFYVERDGNWQNMPAEKLGKHGENFSC